MPHQCLKCGKIFEDGSPELLKGCPNCGGNRFIFIKKPLSEEERKDIEKKVEDDIYAQVTKLLGKENRLEELKPRELKEAFFQIAEQESKKQVFGIDEKSREEMVEKLIPQESEEPETIRIKTPGEYELDLKGLLEEEPIIIQKDGSYVIHLPSVFERARKEQKKR
ncbi:MAG TPA: hypothetical protein ENI14_00750 [Thermoplasmatales archaeon]|nr:hypothetical protein [Thermoplasmatales archaeon]